MMKQESFQQFRDAVEENLSRFDPKLHHRRVGHLKHMSRAPNPLIKQAASLMLSALNKSPEADVFKELEFDYRASGQKDMADTIEDLAEVLDEKIPNPPRI